MDAGAGADVEHVVGGADRVLVVLDDDHGVAEVAQPLAAFRAAARCRAGAGRSRARPARRARLEARADLRGEPDALALAARERAGGAGQREVFQADVDQELEPLADLLEHADRDLFCFGVEPRRQFGEPFAGVLDRHSRTPRRRAGFRL